MDNYRIQSFVLPRESIHKMCRDLFFHADAFVDNYENCLFLGVGKTADFTTYLNGCLWAKWKKYTNVENLSLHIELEGKAQLTYVGYSMKHREIIRKDFDILRNDYGERRTVDYQFPENDEIIVGVEISAISNVKIYNGFYTVECDNEKLRKVDIAIATTTYRKEEYIKHNIEAIKTEILCGQDELKDHLEVHVVDNGRTLKKEDLESEHIHLHPNKNVGGSGGFARGMIEALHQEKSATHVLLMDDDVIVLPESIIRTYHLLVLMKNEYCNHFVSGAMLKMEVPVWQHEDVGIITDVDCRPLKPGFDLSRLIDVLRNDGAYYNSQNKYGAWWYSCIPLEVIKKEGLPLPIFVRIDDIEYSLRCKADFITMGGICVWHMGFEYKSSEAMQYQTIRNYLIVRAIRKDLQCIDFYSHYLHLAYFAMMKFDYNGMRLILKAIDDYLKGPAFLENADGEEILKQNNKLNEKYVPLSNHKEFQVLDVFDCFRDDTWNKKDDIWLNLTDNGQKRGKFKYKTTPIPLAPNGNIIQWAKIARRREYGVVNPFDETVTIRKKDKKQYRELMKKFKNIK